MPDGADIEVAARGESPGALGGWLRWSWRVAVCFAIFTGMLHLVNLVAVSRFDAGPMLMTPFRVAFVAAWILLLLIIVRERSIPRLNRIDLIVIVFTLAYCVRGLFLMETLSVALNWIVTAAGVYLLVRLGTRDRRDARAFIYVIIAAALVITVYGLIEYFSKYNMFFDAIEVDAIGSDSRIEASGQYYRIRSLVGHPGFAAAILLASVPLTLMALWRRHLALFFALGATMAALLLTFSRGSWLLAAIVVIPLTYVAFKTRLRRYLPWLGVAAALLAVVVAAAYLTRGEAYLEFGDGAASSGMDWSEGTGVPVDSGPEGIRPAEMFVYADVDDDFGGEPESATVVVHYRDQGLGALRVDYLSDPDPSGQHHDWVISPRIQKTGTGNWTNAAFYMERPKFGGHPYLADLRIVDEDSLVTIRRVEVHEGRLDPLSQIVHQWEARTASFTTRFSAYPLAWDVLRDNPLGVGLFNSPGTEHHAVDSLPLTWVMEMGWPGLLLAAGLVALVIAGVVRALSAGKTPATVIFLAMLLLLLHGGHLMILYDKPSIVMLGALAAIYAATWRRADGGETLALSLSDIYV